MQTDAVLGYQDWGTRGRRKSGIRGTNKIQKWRREGENAKLITPYGTESMKECQRWRASPRGEQQKNRSGGIWSREWEIGARTHVQGDCGEKLGVSGAF